LGKEVDAPRSSKRHRPARRRSRRRGGESPHCRWIGAARAARNSPRSPSAASLRAASGG